MPWNPEQPRDERGRFASGLSTWAKGANDVPEASHQSTSASLKSWAGHTKWTPGKSDTFYRLHHDDLPSFSAKNAYSHPWGEYGTDEGLKSKQRGYSSMNSAEGLLNYFGSRGGMPDNARIVAFKGKKIGIGPDGEPLTIPSGPAHWYNKTEFHRVVSAERQGLSIPAGVTREPKIDRKALKAKRAERERAAEKARIEKVLATPFEQLVDELGSEKIARIVIESNKEALARYK